MCCPDLLSMEVMQRVIGHIYLNLLYSSDHLKGKWREPKACHIRETTVITKIWNRRKVGASNFGNVSFKLKCQVLRASLGIYPVGIYHKEYYHRLLIWDL